MKVSSLMGKIKIDKAFRVVLRVFAAQVPGIPVASACRPIQRKADSIKNGGFSGTGISRDQKKTSVLKLLKIDHGHGLCIWAESTDDQFNRLHSKHLPFPRSSA